MRPKNQTAKKHRSPKSMPKLKTEKIASSSAVAVKPKNFRAKKPFEKRPLGMDKCAIKIADDFDAPLPQGVFDSSD
jgi:hypothetical protein